MRTFGILWAVCLFCLLTPLAIQAQVSPEKRIEIEKMLPLTGMEKIMEQLKQQMLVEMQKALPDTSTQFWKKLSKKMQVKELIEKAMPVYDKYYTLEDLKSINAFNESPAGIRMRAVMPMVANEIMTIGKEWGEEIGKQAAQEIDLENKLNEK